MEGQENKLNFTKADVKETLKSVEAIIVSINLVRAIDVYGQDKVKDDKQELIKVSVQNGNYDINEDEYLPYYAKDNVPENSKLGKFLLKYDKLEVSQKITLTKDKDGFYKIET